MRIEVKVNRLVKHVNQSQDGFGFECVCFWEDGASFME